MRILGIIVALTITGGAGAALAQDEQPRCRMVEGPRPYMQCDEITIEGDDGRAFVVLPRSRDDYEPPPLERELTSEIRRSVRRAPF